MHNVNELRVWQKSIELVVEIYKATANFPDEEKYGLTSQIRRSAVSISSNIAEGAGRNSDKEFNHFLGIANGSSYELSTQLIVAKKLELLKSKIAGTLLEELECIQKMTYRLMKSLSK